MDHSLKVRRAVIARGLINCCQEHRIQYICFPLSHIESFFFFIMSIILTSVMMGIYHTKEKIGSVLSSKTIGVNSPVGSESVLKILFSLRIKWYVSPSPPPQHFIYLHSSPNTLLLYPKLTAFIHIPLLSIPLLFPLSSPPPSLSLSPTLKKMIFLIEGT